MAQSIQLFDLLPHVQLDWTVKYLQCCFRTSALSWRLKIWNSASTLLLCLDCQRPDVPLPHCLDCQRSEDPLPLCLYCQRSEFPRPNFRSALTAKNVKFRFRTSALPWLPKIWSSAFRTCSARTSKDVKFRFCISSLPGLPKIWSFASALSLNLDCQRSEDRLLH